MFIFKKHKKQMPLYKVGVHTDIMEPAYIDMNCEIGNYTFIGRYSNITRAKIGNYCSIGNFVAIGPGEHEIDSISTSSFFTDGDVYQKLTQKDCIIGNDVWIGTNSIIRRGVVVGDNSTSNGCNIRICEDNTNVEIGLDCMFSSGIKIWASDTHTITDMDGNCLNVGKYVKIGNHVWIGSNVSIAKNTVVADGCVVGMATVLTGKHDEQNCVIAGNPSKKVKQNIKWDRRRPKQYIKEEKNENS